MKEFLHFFDVLSIATILLNILVMILNAADIEIERAPWFQFLFFCSISWALSRWII